MLIHADGLDHMQQTLSVWSLSVYQYSTRLQVSRAYHFWECWLFPLLFAGNSMHKSMLCSPALVGAISTIRSIFMRSAQTLVSLREAW